MLKSLYYHSDGSLIDQLVDESLLPSNDCSLSSNRAGQKSVDQIFSLSVKLHDRLSEEKTVLVGTTVQEKNVWNIFSRKPSWKKVSIIDDTHKRPPLIRQT